MTDTDIKLNLIIKELKSMKQILNIIIKDHYPELNLDLESNQSINQSNESMNHDLAREDNLEWFKKYLGSIGIDPENRLYDDAVMKSISYFRTKFPELTNPEKYCMKFVPKQIKPRETPGKSETDDNGYTMEQIQGAARVLTHSIIEETKARSTRIRDLLIKNPKFEKMAMFKSAVASEALRLGLV